MTLKFNGLGTTWVVELDFEDKELEIKINKTVIEFEKTYSRFLKSSALSELNNNKVIENPTTELIELINFAISFYKETDSIFNICVGGTLEDMGYGEPTNTSTITNPIEAIEVGKDYIRLSQDTRIDFGGFGKGWLVDKIAKLIKANNYSEFLINAGGDIFSNKEAEIYLEHPVFSDQFIGKILLNKKGLACSSREKRKWTHNNKEFNHIVETAGLSNMDSKQKIIGSFVVADDLAKADAMATTGLIAPINLFESLISKLKLECMLILENGSSVMSPGFNLIAID